ncbi:MAG: hypothetical protein AAF682_12935 [Planctomycetota bacterium]
MIGRLPAAFAGLLALAAFAQEPDEPATLDPLGTGEHVYEWVHDWARLPEGTELGYTHGCIAIDSADRVYVQTNGPESVFVFSPDGELLRTFGDELAGGLHGMTLVEQGGEELLYLTHLEGEVIQCTLEGEIRWRLGYPEESGKYEDGERYHPTGVAVSKTGDFFVADGYGRHWIHRYDKDRNYVASFGGPGKDKGQLRNPHGIWIEERDGREILIVADRQNRRLQVFGLDGKPLRVLTDGIRRPCTVARGADGCLVVPDIDGKVTLLDPKGRLLTHLGEHPDPKMRDRKDVPRAEQQPGLFYSPHGAQWDSSGDLYVVEWLEEGRLTKLRRVRR